MVSTQWFGWWLAVGVLTWALVLAQYGWQQGWFSGHRLRAPKAAPSSRTKQFLAHVVAPVLATVAIVLAWPLVWGLGLQELHLWYGTRRRRQAATFKVRRQDLVRATTVAEVEQAERIHDPLGAVPDHAFGHLHDAWQRFVACRPPHTQLWVFARAWTDERGQARELRGYVWVSGGRRTPWWISHDRPCEAVTGGQ